MSFSQLLSILRARIWVVLGVFAAVVIATLAASLLMSKKYTAAASVMVDMRPDAVSATGLGTSMLLPGFMATQVDILNSDRVTQRVIADLKLLDNADLRGQWQEATKGQGSFQQWLAEILQRALLVRPSRESSVIQVEYSSADPRFAAALANAFAQAYISTTLELRVGPARQFATFFNTQVKEARDALEQAQNRYSAFQRAKGIIATDERLDVENARLNELSSQLTQVQAISAESNSRRAQAQGSEADRLHEVLANPLIGQMRADLTRAEARLQELMQRLGDAHPQVAETRASIGELRSRIETETRRVTGGVGVTAAINQSREAQMRSALAAQRARVLEMKAVRDEGVVLQREVENAQRLYDNLFARMNQTSLESQATQSFASMLTPAQPPVRPSSPRVLLNTALAVCLGALLAVVVALALEVFDRRVRSAEDVAFGLGLPVLGTLPGPKAKRFRHGALVLPPPAAATPRHALGQES